jgi:uncharacterized protein (DUF2132 family)
MKCWEQSFLSFVLESDISSIKNYYCCMQTNNPLHGKTLAMILQYLVDHFGWEELGNIISINCFKNDPSIKSSLTFLRKTPWARKKVEDLYLSII